jgi:hypothetical protein
MAGAVIGLVSGTLMMTAMMLLWNYLITPMYMNVPREVIASMLLDGFLPFNLFKGGLNVAGTLMLYKPISTALRRANLAPASPVAASKGRAAVTMTLVVLAAALALIPELPRVLIQPIQFRKSRHNLRRRPCRRPRLLRRRQRLRPRPRRVLTIRILLFKWGTFFAGCVFFCRYWRRFQRSLRRFGYILRRRKNRPSSCFCFRPFSQFVGSFFGSW